MRSWSRLILPIVIVFMTYILPVFNTQANVWHGQSGSGCPTGYRDLVVNCNLALGRRGGFNESNPSSMWALFPPLTDIRPPGITVGPPGEDIVEIPANSGRIYTVLAVDDAGLSFTNEHRVAVLRPSCKWPIPVPGGAPVPEPPTELFIVDSLIVGPSGPFASTSFNETMPSRGLMIVVVACYENAPSAFGVDATVREGATGLFPFTMNTVVDNADITFGAVTCRLSVFSYPVSAGVWGINLNHVPGTVTMYQVKVFLLQSSPGNLFSIGTADSVVGPPSVAIGAVNTLIPACYLSAFVLLNPVGVTGWNGPFIDAGIHLQAVTLAVTCQLVAATFVSGVLSIPTGSLAVVVCDEWIGNISGYQ